MFSLKKFGDAKNRTQDGWVGSANATSVLCLPPLKWPSHLSGFYRMVQGDAEAAPVVKGVDFPEVELLVEVAAFENFLIAIL